MSEKGDYLWEENSSDKIKEWVKENKAAILPFGAVEDHGPHLPAGTDNFICEKVCELLAKETGDVVLPTIKYSYVWSLGDKTGTISLSYETLRKVIFDIACELHRQSIRTLICIDAHLGNGPVIKTAVRDIIQVYPDMKCMYFTYLDSVSDVDVFESQRASGRYIHACEIETSAMLYSKPEVVDMSKTVRNYPNFPPRSSYLNLRWSEFTKIAVLGDPTCATEQKGKKLLETAVKRIADFIKKEREM
jgi:creatinine amidohydrolase